MGRKVQVVIAEPFDDKRINSLGDAEYMLVAQHRFPLEYDLDQDEFVSCDSDRLTGSPTR